ncbi:MAG TPA: hypothetical protein VMW37_04850 [Dehalococcoidales bacterium]|nr:hypothetical protein [Dehalococcoidales bacterium]
MVGKSATTTFTRDEKAFIKALIANSRRDWLKETATPKPHFARFRKKAAEQWNDYCKACTQGTEWLILLEQKVDALE